MNAPQHINCLANQRERKTVDKFDMFLEVNRNESNIGGRSADSCLCSLHDFSFLLHLVLLFLLSSDEQNVQNESIVFCPVDERYICHA